MSDPEYYSIISRESVEIAAGRDDALGALAHRMLTGLDEQAAFRAGVKIYLANTDRGNRRFAIAVLAKVFGANRTELKQLLRFWGLVNERD